MSTRLKPGDQERGWSNRWEDIEETLDRLLQPRTGGYGAAGIQTAEQELLAFYTLAYHLKDLLKNETKVPGQQIEDAISNTPELALLCDLANLTKHGSLKRIRSGAAPVIASREGFSCEGGWQVAVTIRHGAGTRDGLEVAQEAVDAWRAQLAGWSLI